MYFSVSHVYISSLITQLLNHWWMIRWVKRFYCYCVHYKQTVKAKVF